jgi:uncharacterized delta-60 repeat protein
MRKRIRGATKLLTSPVDLAVSEGTNLTLNVDFKGVPSPSVGWLLNGSAVIGASGNTLRLQNILGKDTGDYTIALTNNLGVATGLVARLTVLPAPNTPGAADVVFDPGEALINPGSVSIPPAQASKSLIRALAVQPDGKILAGGSFGSFDGVLTKGLVRLNGDGSLDRAFLSNALAIDSDFPLVEDILVQSDGKVIVAGNYRREGTGSLPLGGLSRLNPDGTVDSLFNADVEADSVTSPPFRIAFRPDGKILVSGGSLYFRVNGASRFHLAALNPDGSPDPAFNTNAGVKPFGQIRALCVQADGRALVGGFFSGFNGVPQNHFVRLGTDGNLDTSFAIGSGPDGTVHAIRMQPDGKILVGGGFSAFAGVPRIHLARLSSDGSLDMTFDPGTNIVGIVQAIELQPDGKILAAGGLYIGVGRQTNCVVRLFPDGSLDPTFETRSDDVVYDLVRLDDGRIAVGGAFSRLDNVLRNGIAVLHGDPLLINPSRSSGVFSTIVKTTTGRAYMLEFRSSLNEETWTPLQEMVGDGSVLTLTDPNPNSPKRFYRVRVD